MFSGLDGINITCGFLIVKMYACLYQDYVSRYDLKQDIYAIPRIDRTTEQSPIQYRGIDRDALSDYNGSHLAAEIRMATLNDQKRCSEGFIFDAQDADEVYQLLPEPEQYEVIWVRTPECEQSHPEGFVSVGYEPTWLLGDHFSALCDCMIIPRWHGTDDGKLFLEHFQRLNRFGLFSTSDEARAFLDYYLSFDWTEIGEYVIAEVFIKE